MLPQHFTYQNGHLFCENVSVESIAQKQGTPIYIYSYAHIANAFRILQTALAPLPHLICYEMRANANAAIVKMLALLGAGINMMSVWELRRALALGIPASKIVYSGICKTSEDLHFAVGQGILQFNIESEQELVNLQRIAHFLDKKVSIALRIYLETTPQKKQRIQGVSLAKAVELYELAKGMSHIELTGAAFCLTHPISDSSQMAPLAHTIKTSVQDLQNKGALLHHLCLSEDFFDLDTAHPILLNAIKDLKLNLIIETGKRLLKNAGIFVTKVAYLKKTEDGKHLTIVDSGVNDIKPISLNLPTHAIQPTVIKTDRPVVTTHLIGATSEPMDFFDGPLSLTLTGPGEHLAVLGVGAYGMSLASNDCSRPKPSEILVKDKMYYVIRKPDKMEHITGREELPEFLKEMD